LINATDISLGSRFEFTQDQFDLICSNLSDYSIGRAVAASSAFPILLSPITLNNYAGKCGFEEPEWIANALLDRDIAQRRFTGAQKTRSYQESKERPFIHLLDGGVADNIGLRGPYEAVSSVDSPWSVLRMINLDKVAKVVVIVVNAKSDPDTKIDRKKNAPGWKEVLMAVATDPMDNYSFETIELLVNSFEQWQKDYDSKKSCEKKLKKLCPEKEFDSGDLTKIDFYPVVIGFDMITDEVKRNYFKNLPTTFNLPSETIDRLRGIGSILLDESKNFKMLLQDLQ
jgi:NTE family protein